MAKDREQTNHDILLEGDSQRTQTLGIRKKRKNTRYNR